MISLVQLPAPEDLEQIIDAESVTAGDFAWAAAVVVLSLLGARLLRRILRSALTRIPSLADEAALLISRAAGWIVILLGVVYALALVGVDMGPALMVILILSVVLFFAGRGIVENLAAGLVLQGAPMFAAGDEIETPSATGEVSEITGRTVIVVSVDGEEIHIPNKTVIGDPIVNLTRIGSRRSTLDVEIVYGSDLDRVKDIIEQSALECDVTHPEPRPEAFVSAFGANGIKFSLMFWHVPTIMGTVRAIDEVARSVARALSAAEISFAFPQRMLWWGNGERPAAGSEQ